MKNLARYGSYLGLALVGALVATTGAACGSDEDDDGTGGTGAASSSGSGGAGGDPGSGASSSSSSSSSSGSTGGSSDGGAGVGGTGQGGAGQGGAGQGGAGQGGGGSLTCDPEGSDTPCTTCLKTMCCDQIEDCNNSASCQACADCVLTSGDALACIQDMQTCDQQDPATAALIQCGGGCAASCL
jgi:hypothetical protein